MLVCVLFAGIVRSTGISASDVITTLQMLKLIDDNEEPDVR